MINFNTYKLANFIHLLEVSEKAAMLRGNDGYLDDEDKAPWPEMLDGGFEQCEGLPLAATKNRIARLKTNLNRNISWVEWKKDLQSLRETVIDDLKEVYCYRYPEHKARVYWDFGDQWFPITGKFPSVMEDALSAVDCYGMNQNTASVFHAMRVAEIGLRTLAKERRVKFKKKPLEWAHWQDMINGIRGKVKIIEGKRSGPNRAAALDFYQGAMGEFEAFKDAYRNNVMHVRISYDEHQAISVLNHVREFMQRLAAKVGESDKKQIKWGRW